MAGVEGYLRHLEGERFLAESTVKHYRYQLDVMFRELPDQFSEDELRDIIRRRLGPESESVFVARNSYLALNGFYKWWERHGGYPNPVAEARVPHAPEIERAGMTKDELRLLLQRLPDRPLKEQAIVRLILHDGFRVGDVVKLEVRDIDFEHKQIRARWRKGRKVQDMPMDDDLATTLRAYLDEHHIDQGVVFRGLTNKPMVTQSIWKAFKRAAGKDLKHIKPHQGRHSFGTALGREVRADPRTIQRLLGHRDLKTSQRYWDTSKDAEGAAIFDLAAYYRDLQAGSAGRDPGRSALT